VCRVSGEGYRRHRRPARSKLSPVEPHDSAGVKVCDPQRAIAIERDSGWTGYRPFGRTDDPGRSGESRNAVGRRHETKQQRVILARNPHRSSRVECNAVEREKTRARREQRSRWLSRPLRQQLCRVESKDLAGRATSGPQTFRERAKSFRRNYRRWIDRSRTSR
jgi:hypothetical protein